MHHWVTQWVPVIIIPFLSGLPQPFPHRWCTWFCLQALCVSSSSHDLSIFQTTLQETRHRNTVNKTRLYFVIWYLKKHTHSNSLNSVWSAYTVKGLNKLTKYMTFALQECGHKFIKCSWILEECSHLVEVVWRHQNILRVSHDIDHLRRLQILIHQKRIKKKRLCYYRMTVQAPDLGFGCV